MASIFLVQRKKIVSFWVHISFIQSKNQSFSFLSSKCYRSCCIGKCKMKYENNYDILDFRKPKKVYISQPFLLCWQNSPIFPNVKKTVIKLNLLLRDSRHEFIHICQDTYPAADWHWSNRMFRPTPVNSAIDITLNDIGKSTGTNRLKNMNYAAHK